MTLELKSPCKVNLLLNILRKRPDGFHDLETLFHPVPVYDILTFRRTGSGIHLTCSDPSLPVDSTNLVYRAAASFLERTKIGDGVSLHLEKYIPQAAGLGGGSGNAATTLLGLNQLFEYPLEQNQLHELAASLGSDIPFFLQYRPAIATGRGENVQPIDDFPALKGVYILLVHPGFGISTPWSYQQLSRFPQALNGTPGRAARLATLLQQDLSEASCEFYNALEMPALEKFPLLALLQEFFRENGAAVALMSGSGSATFALVQERKIGEQILEKFKTEFGQNFWLKLVPISS